jgi:hypothetical protein
VLKHFADDHVVIAVKKEAMAGMNKAKSPLGSAPSFGKWFESGDGLAAGVHIGVKTHLHMTHCAKDADGAASAAKEINEVRAMSGMMLTMAANPQMQQDPKMKTMAASLDMVKELFGNMKVLQKDNLLHVDTSVSTAALQKAAAAAAEASAAAPSATPPAAPSAAPSAAPPSKR